MKPRVKRKRASKSLQASGMALRSRSDLETVEPSPHVPKMLILRGIAGHFAGRDWPKGALDEPSALAFAERAGYIGSVLNVPGTTGAKSKQTLMALHEFRQDQSVQAFYGFSGGGYNVRHIIEALTADEKIRIRTLVVLGAPKNPPSLYAGPWDLVYRLDPPTGHMDGPRALLAELPDPKHPADA
jgi:hypothetical protein